MVKQHIPKKNSEPTMKRAQPTKKMFKLPVKVGRKHTLPTRKLRQPRISKNSSV
jgi:hypothetical protein